MGRHPADAGCSDFLPDLCQSTTCPYRAWPADVRATYTGLVVTRRTILLLVLLALLLACGGGGPTAETAAGAGASNDGEIETALRAYLAARTDLNLSSLEVDIVNVSQTGDSASATAEFRAPGGAEPMLAMGYQLERVAGEWTVLGSGSANAAAPPPAGWQPQGDLPAGHPPTDAPMGGGGLPSGHPQVDGPAGGGLPPGHPPTAPPAGGGEALPPGHPPVVQ